MRIIAITTFSPSQNVLSTFGAQCVKGFLKIQDIKEVIVLGDKTSQQGEALEHEHLIVDRCWRQNSLLNLITIARKVYKYSPDIVWINVQYTLFGPGLFSSFVGLFIIPLLKLMGYPVVVVLHNYYGAINVDKLGMSGGVIFKILMIIVDPIIMHTILMANKVFVMTEEYFNDLRMRFPFANVEYVEQDLWDVPSYQPVNPLTKNILVFGVFGTYKKLDPLLNVLPKIQSILPDVKLIVAGQNHPQVPGYLENIFNRYSKLLISDGVLYKGYIRDSELIRLYFESNIVVLTNSVVAGSSATLRFASCFGRGVIIPSVDEYDKLDDDLWGVVKYAFGNDNELLEKILQVLSSYDLQVSLSQKNYSQAVSGKNNFTSAHKEAFQKLLCIKQNYEL